MVVDEVDKGMMTVFYNETFHLDLLLWVWYNLQNQGVLSQAKLLSLLVM